MNCGFRLVSDASPEGRIWLGIAEKGCACVSEEEGLRPGRASGPRTFSSLAPRTPRSKSSAADCASLGFSGFDRMVRCFTSFARIPPDPTRRGQRGDSARGRRAAQRGGDLPNALPKSTPAVYSSIGGLS